MHYQVTGTREVSTLGLRPFLFRFSCACSLVSPGYVPGHAGSLGNSAKLVFMVAAPFYTSNGEGVQSFHTLINWCCGPFFSDHCLSACEGISLWFHFAFP